MRRPLIGITAYAVTARWGVWDRPVTLVPQTYVEAVHEAGGRPVLLPPLPGAGVDGLDGLVLAGGPDLDPALYGAEPDPRTDAAGPDRDAAEPALLRAAVAADLPVLGVCRGAQLLVALAGGALVQHLPGHVGGQGVFARHPVVTVPGSLLAGLVGPELDVPSYHHQGIADAGTLRPAAHAPDGTVEAVEDPVARFRLGVLWHPEQDPDRRLFERWSVPHDGTRFPSGVGPCHTRRVYPSVIIIT